MEGQEVGVREQQEKLRGNGTTVQTLDATWTRPAGAGARVLEPTWHIVFPVSFPRGNGNRGQMEWSREGGVPTLASAQGLSLTVGNGQGRWIRTGGLPPDLCVLKFSECNGEFKDAKNKRRKFSHPLSHRTPPLQRPLLPRVLGFGTERKHPRHPHPLPSTSQRSPAPNVGRHRWYWWL